MVQFAGVETIGELVRAKGAEPFLAGLAGYIEQDFLRWEAFDKRARIGAHSNEGVIELMPTSDGDLYGFKYVNGHPDNTHNGQLTVTGFGVLADMHTGYPLFLSEMTLATALRTGATSALAAKYLARKDSQTMAIIGLGAQSEFQALAFAALLGIRNLRVFDTDAAATKKFLANLAHADFSIFPAGSVGEALRGADVVTTATASKARAAVITREMVAPGVHFNAIGGDCPGKTEFHRDALTDMKIFVEFPPQTRIEGEIQQLAPDAPVTELWRVIAGKAAGRSSAGDVTLFDSVGFAIEDFSCLRYLRDQMSLAGMDRRIDLLPQPPDPKNLFGLLAGAKARAPFARVA